MEAAIDADEYLQPCKDLGHRGDSSCSHTVTTHSTGVSSRQPSPLRSGLDVTLVCRSTWRTAPGCGTSPIQPPAGWRPKLPTTVGPQVRPWPRVKGDALDIWALLLRRVHERGRQWARRPSAGGPGSQVRGSGPGRGHRLAPVLPSFDPAPRKTPVPEHPSRFSTSGCSREPGPPGAAPCCREPGIFRPGAAVPGAIR